MQVATTGLVLRQVKVGEADRILTILTPDLGVVSASARGSLRMKSALFSATGLFCYSEFTLTSGRSHYFVDTAQVKKVFHGISASIEGMALASYMAEIAAELRVTPSAVRHARQRYGRFSTGTDGLCIVCDARPVFDTSAQAKKWRLCKGCYLAERKRRLEEEAESNRIRQAAHRRQKLDGDV